MLPPTTLLTAAVLADHNRGSFHEEGPPNPAEQADLGAIAEQEERSPRELRQIAEQADRLRTWRRLRAPNVNAYDQPFQGPQELHLPPEQSRPPLLAASARTTHVPLGHDAARDHFDAVRGQQRSTTYRDAARQVYHSDGITVVGSSSSEEGSGPPRHRATAPSDGTMGPGPRPPGPSEPRERAVPIGVLRPEDVAGLGASSSSEGATRGSRGSRREHMGPRDLTHVLRASTWVLRQADLPSTWGSFDPGTPPQEAEWRELGEEARQEESGQFRSPSRSANVGGSSSEATVLPQVHPVLEERDAATVLPQAHPVLEERDAATEVLPQAHPVLEERDSAATVLPQVHPVLEERDAATVLPQVHSVLEGRDAATEVLPQVHPVLEGRDAATVLPQVHPVLEEREDPATPPQELLQEERTWSANVGENPAGGDVFGGLGPSSPSVAVGDDAVGSSEPSRSPPADEARHAQPRPAVHVLVQQEVAPVERQEGAAPGALAQQQDAPRAQDAPGAHRNEPLAQQEDPQNEPQLNALSAMSTAPPAREDVHASRPRPASSSNGGVGQPRTIFGGQQRRGDIVVSYEAQDPGHAVVGEVDPGHAVEAPPGSHAAAPFQSSPVGLPLGSSRRPPSARLREQNSLRASGALALRPVGGAPVGGAPVGGAAPFEQPSGRSGGGP